MIRTERLNKVYEGGTRAIEGLTFRVEPGEIFGFLGPNGAGKSTTVRILTTLSRPTAGRAWVDGKDVVAQPLEVRRAIGYVAQESGVDFFLTGRENLLLQGRLYRMDRRTLHRRVEELLDLFQLREAADDLVSTYSGGMRRKLDIATALVHSPRILFLDEPTLGLDPQSRALLWDYIRSLNRDLGLTVFLTTHYLDEADRLAHRVGILHRGRLVVIDTPEALKQQIRGEALHLQVEKAQRPQALALLKGHSLVQDLLEERDHLRVYVARGGEALPVLLAHLAEAGISVQTVSLTRPTLDDVFLKFTGEGFEAAGREDAQGAWWTQWQKGGWGKGSWGKGSWDKGSWQEGSGDGVSESWGQQGEGGWKGGRLEGQWR